MRKEKLYNFYVIKIIKSLKPIITKILKFSKLLLLSLSSEHSHEGNKLQDDLWDRTNVK